MIAPRGMGFFYVAAVTAYAFLVALPCAGAGLLLLARLPRAEGRRPWGLFLWAALVAAAAAAARLAWVLRGELASGAAPVWPTLFKAQLDWRAPATLVPAAALWAAYAWGGRRRPWLSAAAAGLLLSLLAQSLAAFALLPSLLRLLGVKWVL